MGIAPLRVMANKLSHFRFLIFEVTFDLLILNQYELKMNLNGPRVLATFPIETQTIKPTQKPTNRKSTDTPVTEYLL